MVIIPMAIILIPTTDRITMATTPMGLHTLGPAGIGTGITTVIIVTTIDTNR